MSRTKELLNSTNSPRTRTVPRPRTTGKKITRADTSIPSKHWSMRVKLSSGRKKRFGSPRNPRVRAKDARTNAEVEGPMKPRKQRSPSLGGFSSGTSLGGKVSHYRDKQNIYKQGAPAYTLFYIQAGGVRLTTRTKHQPSAVTAILGAHDFFGELCLAGYPLRVSTAVALTASSIRTIKKQKMLQMLRKKNKTSNSLVAYLLSSVKKYRDHV